MSLNRLQKLLFTEYCDFEDMILIESPFAQTTKDGTGVRQVHLGLTPTKLILATDVLPPLGDILDPSKVLYFPGVDPDIETFELIAIYPIECVNLSVYRYRKRQTLKAHFSNNRVLYFELGGFERRTMFWNLWCERVRFLNPEEGRSTQSETSVGTSSSTTSTLYLIDKRIVIKGGLKQLWYKFGPTSSQIIGNGSRTIIRKWSDKNLYMGRMLNERPSSYMPIVVSPVVDEFVRPKQESDVVRRATSSNENIPKVGQVVRVNRFGSGVYEGCNTGLYLTMENCTPQETFSQFILRQTNLTPKYIISSTYNFLNYEEIAENAVRKWEMEARKNFNKNRLKHRRRYGFVPYANFLYGFGMEKPLEGCVYSICVKRAISLISFQCEPKEEELRLNVPKRQLISSISLENVHLHSEFISNIKSAPKAPVLFFWTTNHWYQPCSAKEVYTQFQNHLKNVKRGASSKKIKSRKRTILMWRRRSDKQNGSDVEEAEEKPVKKTRKKFLANTLFDKRTDNVSEVDRNVEPCQQRKPQESLLDYQKRILELDIIVTAKDFNSTTLAEQLTIIEKELFLKIDRVELKSVVYEKYKKCLPNITACIAFSHRIICLIATEILKDPLEKIRARLIARFINVAEKCHRMSNFQTCKTVLLGLQCPPIYRLRRTWTYVRKKHATKYHVYEFLCGLYKDVRLPIYQRTFYIASQTPPYMPYVGDIFAKLLDKVPEYKIRKRRAPSLSPSHSSCSSKCMEETINNKFFMKFLSIFSSNKQKECIKESFYKDIKPMAQNNLLPINNTDISHFNGPDNCYQSPYKIEDNGVNCLSNCEEFLEKSQLGATHYNFPVNDLARNYLLKARYCEEFDNFKRSLVLEASNCNIQENKPKTI